MTLCRGRKLPITELQSGAALGSHADRPLLASS